MIDNQLNRLITRATVFALGIQLIGAATARADRDVFLADVGGQVGIGSANDTPPTEPALTTRVFSRVLVPGFPPPTFPDYGLDEPGFFALPAGDAELPLGSSALPANKDVSVNVLPFTIGSGTDTLFYWNGVGAVNFVPISTAQSDVSLVIDPIDPMFPNVIGSTGATGGADIHATYRLEKTGAGVPADGAYLISPTVGVAGLTNSPRIFELFLADSLVTSEEDAEELLEGLEMGQPIFAGKDFSFFADAGNYVQNNLAVPEPCSLAFVGLAGIGFVLCGARQRSTRRSSQR